MCGIAGYCSLEENFLQTKEKQEKQVADMGRTIRHRGPDDFRIYVGEHIAFAHTRLAVIDPER